MWPVLASSPPLPHYSAQSKEIGAGKMVREVSMRLSKFQLKLEN